MKRSEGIYRVYWTVHLTNFTGNGLEYEKYKINSINL